MKVKEQIPCQFCDARARLLGGKLAIPRNPNNTRYGCSSGHLFAVPTKSVEVK